MMVIIAIWWLGIDDMLEEMWKINIKHRNSPTPCSSIVHANISVSL